MPIPWCSMPGATALSPDNSVCVIPRAIPVFSHQYSMSTTRYDFDLFVIGAGSGGVRAARMAAAKHGVSVAIAEQADLGGTCVNVGCVPKKLFVYGAHFSEDFEDSVPYGWERTQAPTFNWETLRNNKNREIARLNGIYRKLLLDAGVRLLEDRARLVDEHRVLVGDRQFTAERILVTTGSRPHVPEIPGIEHAVTSNEVFFLETFPRRVLIVGGGYIALEFAGIFNGLGAETVLSYRRSPFLRGFDRDIREIAAQEVGRKGVQLKFDSVVEGIEKSDDGTLRVCFKNGEAETTDLVMNATGRRANTEGLGLEKVGVNLREDGSIVVDPFFQTSVPSIYALGDVIGGLELTPVALAEAMALVRHLYGGDNNRLDYSAIPTAVFCQPNIATVGPTEEQARKQYANIRVYKSSFRPMKHSLSGRREKTMMKLIVDDATDRVIAAHMLGSEAGEIIQGIAIAIKAGATKTQFDQTIGIHPTAAEEFVTMRQPL